MTWTPPEVWSVPKLWPNERCFVICGGESVRAQRGVIPHLPGPIIAVKEAVFLKPDADVLFFSGERPEDLAPRCLAQFLGRYLVVRGRGHRIFPASAKLVGRTVTHTAWSDDPTLVAGYDSGTSAINLAMLFGATEIVVLGYDMVGGRWFNGELPHFMPKPRESDFQKHLSVLPALAEDARRRGIRIINTSPISRVDVFEQAPLEQVLRAA